MKNKKLTISIIVILVVVVAAAAGYFAYGYYCHTNQVNLLKAKVEEFDKLSFDKEKDQKIKVCNDLKSDKDSYDKAKEDYEKTLDKMYGDFSEYYSNKMNKIETKDLTVDVLARSLKEFDDLKKEIKKDNIIDGKDIISKIDKKINALKDKSYGIVIASLNPSYEECLLSEDEITSAARSTLEGYVSQLQTDIETVNGSELLSSDQKEKFASEANNYISLYNQKIEELKQQEAAEAAKKKEQQQAQAAANNSSAGSSAPAASASGGRSVINGYEVPLDDIQRHINAGHNVWVGEIGDLWMCFTDDAHWAKGYNY